MSFILRHIGMFRRGGEQGQIQPPLNALLQELGGLSFFTQEDGGYLLQE